MAEQTDVNAPQWLDADGRLMVGRDPTNGRLFYPPRPYAPRTLAAAELVAVSGRGTVYTFSIVRRAPPETAVVAFITLEEGPTMLTNIVDCDPDSVRIGQPVTMRVRERDGAPAPVFAPA